jgi:hypothetical protein
VHLACLTRRTEEVDGLAGDFLGRVAVHPLGGRVPTRDDAVQGLADDGIIGMLDNRSQLLRALVSRFCRLAAGQVAHRRDHQRAVLGVGMGQRDVHRELGAVLSPSAQFQIQSHGPRERGHNIALPVHLMDRPQRLGHQHLQGHTDQVAPLVAEQQLRLAIHKPDHACVIHPHQSIRHRLQQTLTLRHHRRHRAPLATVARQLQTGTSSLDRNATPRN